MLAELAGVTPRTLRHYRSIGLLPEPARSENGYCNYSTTDLTRVLRIKRFAALGFSLNAITEMLDEPGQASEKSALERLNELDSELVAQIEELQRQRLMLTLLKERGADVDIPPEFIDITQKFTESGMASKHLAMEREAMILAGHFLDEKTLDEVALFYQTLADHDAFDCYMKFDARISDLAFDASKAERAELVAESVALLTPLLDHLKIESFEEDEEGTPESVFVDQYKMDRFNEAQLDVFEQIIEALRAQVRRNADSNHLPSSNR